MLKRSKPNEFEIIPNSKFLASGIKSLMRDKGPVRFRIKIIVAYNSDIILVRKIIMAAIDHDVRIEKEPIPTIILREFENSGIAIEVRFYMKEIFNSENILSDVRFQILEDFRTNKIIFPFPQVVVHMDK